MIGKKVTVIVDRPMGTYHPEHKDLYYPVNYGYIDDIFAPDGEEQDAYILGVDEPLETFTGVVCAIIRRRNDVEDKWVVTPENLSFSKEEIYNLVSFQEKYFDVDVIMLNELLNEKSNDVEKAVIKDAIEFVGHIFKDDSSGHDYFHTMRVYKTATRIALQENANLIIVQLAALLHDVDDIKLSPETHMNKDRAETFLKKHNISEKLTEMICNIIEEVSFKGTESITPETIEGKCVQDADRLDALGAIGIARTFAYGGSHNRMIYDPEIKPVANMNADKYKNHISTTINHFYEKLFRLKDLMNTDTAKNMAKQRENYMKTFISEFLEEWDGIC